MKKHILCFGDSNTHGYCADPTDCADGGNRFNESERWTCLLQQGLGNDYLVIEEGLNGRTSVFDDPLQEDRSGLQAMYTCLMSHEPIDLMILMLGTNDTCERYGVSASGIALGLHRLIQKAKSVRDVWANDTPNILVVCPPHISPDLYKAPEGYVLGQGCPEKSQMLAAILGPIAQAVGCSFLDAEGKVEMNHKDCLHFTKQGHRQMADLMLDLVPKLVK